MRMLKSESDERARIEAALSRYKIGDPAGIHAASRRLDRTTVNVCGSSAHSSTKSSKRSTLRADLSYFVFSSIQSKTVVYQSSALAGLVTKCPSSGK